MIIGFSDFRITNFDVQILEHFFQPSGGRTQFQLSFSNAFITGVTKFMRSKLGIKKENLKLLFAAQRFSFTHDNILTRKIRYQTI